MTPKPQPKNSLGKFSTSRRALHLPPSVQLRCMGRRILMVVRTMEGVAVRWCLMPSGVDAVAVFRQPGRQLLRSCARTHLAAMDMCFNSASPRACK